MAALDVSYFLTELKDKPPYFCDVQTAGHVPADPTSQGCVSTVKEWIRRCDELHPRCLPRRDASTTPTRLISVGSSSNEIKLCRSSEVPADARYVALSHTWGVKEERKKAMPLLLKENLSARAFGIPWIELTQTFQDAIIITRNIGIPYVWIDSLCIVQDDRDDWAKEAARMASVYKYAYLVIAATSSKNGDDGCLRSREPSLDLTGSLNESFYVQREISHRTIIEWQAESIAMPLLDRAWCFQERLLASRILHYTENEMMWECQEELWCECQLIKFDNPSTTKLETFKLAHAAAVASTNPEIRATSWHKVVREYSQRALTFGTDRLPGISGIAREIAVEVGRLRISGPTIAATLKRTDRKYEASRYDVRLETSDLVPPGKKADVDFTSDIELTESAVSVIILLIQCRTIEAMRGLAEGLVLVPSKIHTGCWERIGKFSGWGLELSQLKETELVIV
ncbi:uncharacterized protein J4E88_009893 [Alternaria novae-zelandiae]|uniref:uncharacterized protein n=1 Tax=Alternaria novae-zelandiae TaxID=430562 RepID=UPI0020C28C1E|nr:uncharacterized protein J4E88_009893 [Alternaria novae-zelandiae]KAI4669611.1 hypothetical protein J4E88_009893 [Alternaria novae-zelandiae]